MLNVQSLPRAQELEEHIAARPLRVKYVELRQIYWMEVNIATRNMSSSVSFAVKHP